MGRDSGISGDIVGHLETFEEKRCHSEALPKNLTDPRARDASRGAQHDMTPGTFGDILRLCNDNKEIQK